MSSHLDRTSLVNRGFVIWLSEKSAVLRDKKVDKKVGKKSTKKSPKNSTKNSTKSSAKTRQISRQKRRQKSRQKSRQKTRQKCRHEGRKNKRNHQMALTGLRSIPTVQSNNQTLNGRLLVLANVNWLTWFDSICLYPASSYLVAFWLFL